MDAKIRMVGYLDIKQLRYFVGIVEANGFSEQRKTVCFPAYSQ